MKNIRFFYLKIFIFFWVVKFSMYLNRRVFVMKNSTALVWFACNFCLTVMEIINK